MAYSSTTERAAASEQLIVNAILPGLHGVKPNRGRDGWSFYCPLDHRKQNAPAAIWVNDDGWISGPLLRLSPQRRAAGTPGSAPPAPPVRIATSGAAPITCAAAPAATH